jgi:Bifunctional DNA primase/polymerase, N-terminal
VTLSIPVIDTGTRMLDAALAYSSHDWYVLPVSRGRNKHAGSILGVGWPEKSSRDPEKIRRWFTAHNERVLGLALHVGRSGAVAFDVDNPTAMPDLLTQALAEHRPPHQSTRTDQPGRGHYVFALPAGVVHGNGVGTLRTEPKWGEVRGTNGIIVCAPTRHERAAVNGRYEWLTTGVLPELPKVLHAALQLPKARIEPRAASPFYAQQRARGLIDKLLTAVEGERNELLFWASLKFGDMVACGHVDHATAEALLSEAARQIRLDDTEAAATIASGISTGARS